MKVVVFLPCRKGSERVRNKNVKIFGDTSLIDIKIKQLLNIPEKYLSKIIVSTNDKKIVEKVLKYSSEKIEIDNRPEKYSTSETTTDSLIQYTSNLIKEGHVLWTHVTSPFFSTKDYVDVIEKYFKLLETKKYDSLCTATKIQKFIWDNNGAINYSSKEEKWPRTQTLSPLFEINSAAFLSSAYNYVKYQDRLGKKPFIYDTNPISAFDIDTEFDFALGEQIYNLHRNELFK